MVVFFKKAYFYLIGLCGRNIRKQKYFAEIRTYAYLFAQKQRFAFFHKSRCTLLKIGGIKTFAEQPYLFCKAVLPVSKVGINSLDNLCNSYWAF